LFQHLSISGTAGRVYRALGIKLAKDIAAEAVLVASVAAVCEGMLMIVATLLR
jgi:diacylglycerol kinase